MVLVTPEDEFSVDPYLPRILAPQAEFRGAGLGGIEPVIGVAGDFLELAIGFVEVDLAVAVAADEFLPADRPLFSRVTGLEVNRPLRGEDLREALPLNVVEGTNHLPFGKEPEVSGEIDLLLQGPGEGLCDFLDLVHVAGGVESLPVGCDSFLRGFPAELRAPLGHQEGHRIPPQFGAWVVEESRDQAVCLFLVDGFHELEGKAAGLRGLCLVGEERLETGEWQGSLRGQLALHDDFHG